MTRDPLPYPLSWPAGWARTAPSARKPAPFFRTEDRGSYRQKRPMTIAVARERLQVQIDLLRADVIALSSNVQLRLDGQPRSGAEDPADPGVALYFVWRGQRVVLACDRWLTVAGNMAAIAAHIEAMRGQERWGVGTLEQAFRGYTALAAPQPARRPWREVLSCTGGSLRMAEEHYRAMAREAHPDRPGGSHEKMAELNAAIAAAREEFGNGV